MLDGYHTDGELFETVSVRDLVSTLTPRLRPAERAVLRELAEGLVLREVASKCGISYPTALKYRRRIAALASRLGVHLPVSSWQNNPSAAALDLTHGSGPKAQLVIKCAIPGNEPMLALGGLTPAMGGASQKKRPLVQVKQAKAGLKAGAGNGQCRQRSGNQNKLVTLANGAGRRLAA